MVLLNCLVNKDIDTIKRVLFTKNRILLMEVKRIPNGKLILKGRLIFLKTLEIGLQLMETEL